ncbi:MAG: hypothetical protein PHX08_00665 [Lachnospiraceae bacterium]|nr:hypothetical protein [Lachnospiraceae bacterium]
MRNSKKLMVALLFIGVSIVVTGVLNYMLLPNSIARVKLHNLRTNKYDDIIIGTSHGLSTINPEVMDEKTGRKSTNLCLPDEHLIDSYYLVKEACRTNKPTRVIYELDPSYWSTPQNNGANSVYIYQNYPMSTVKLEYFKAKIMEMDWRVTLAPWFYYRDQYKSIVKNVKMKTSEAYKKYSAKALSTGGQQYNAEGYMYQIVTSETNKGTLNFILWDKRNIQSVEKKYFKKLVSLCKKEGMELVVITTPVPKETMEKYPEAYKSANEYFTKIMKSYGLKYKNFNCVRSEKEQKGLKDYVDYEGHMTGEAGNEFSATLGNYLKKQNITSSKK